MSTLKVGTIQDHANGNNALVIDSSGRVTQPAKPAFRAEKRASNQTYSGGQPKVTFEHEAFDIGSNYDTSNSRFVAPVSGVYFFQSILRFVGDNNTLDYGKVMLFINGSINSDLFQYNVRTDYMQNSHVNGSCLVQLHANDYAEINVEMSGNNPVIHAHSGGARTYFTGFLVG